MLRPAEAFNIKINVFNEATSELCHGNRRIYLSLNENQWSSYNIISKIAYSTVLKTLSPNIYMR